MKENKTESKLDNQLATEQKAQTGKSKIKLRFTDYAIERFMPSFMVEGKQKDIIETPFDVSKNTILKGLKLKVGRKTKKKYFFLRYWFNGVGLPLTIGQFVKDVFGVKECEKYLYELAKSHQDNKGHWIKDPKQTIKDKETKISKAVIEESSKLTINEVIERLCKANFPKKKHEGRLTANSIRVCCLYLIGRNWRTRHLIYIDDRRGHGQVHFKANYSKRTAKPTDWDNLFSKFPPGHGLDKDKRSNPNNERSVYDSELGKLVIDELNPGLIRKYIERKERAYGTKKNMLDTFKTLWAFAKENHLFGDLVPSNPTTEITFKRPDVSSSPGSIYNDKIFEEHEVKLIGETLVKLRKKYPFQAEALLFMLCTGRRAEETLKIRKSMIDHSTNTITLPASITKARKVEYVDITPPVAFILKLLQEQLDGNYKAYKFLDWLFPTTRINKKRLSLDWYIRSDQCRTKELRGCWRALLNKTELKGAPKMLRKTFSSIAKLELGTSSKARALTGHEQDATLDIHYDKTPRSKAKEYANQVSKIFQFDKAINE